MIRNLLTPLALIVSLLTANSLAIAHHGTNAEYDSEHPITFQATVTEFAFSNPHVQIYFDVKDEKGKIVHWAVEAPSPGRLIRRRPDRARPRGLPGFRVTVSTCMGASPETS